MKVIGIVMTRTSVAAGRGGNGPIWRTIAMMWSRSIAGPFRRTISACFTEPSCPIVSLSSAVPDCLIFAASNLSLVYANAMYSSIVRGGCVGMGAAAGTARAPITGFFSGR
jgi:hypothetical protein